MGKNRISKEYHHVRSKYVDHSQKFVAWINRFEFEKTWLGRVAWQMEERFNLRRICLLFLFCISLSYLLFYDFDFMYPQKIGEIARADIKSPVSFEVVDQVATEEKRVKAEAAVPPVFDYEPEVFDKISNNTFRAFQTERQKLGSGHWPKSLNARFAAVRGFAKKHHAEFEKTIDSDVPERRGPRPHAVVGMGPGDARRDEEDGGERGVRHLVGS